MPPVVPPPPPGPGGSVVSAEMAVDKLTFGPTPGLVAAVRAMGVGAWIDQQLSPAGIPHAGSMLAGSEFDSLRNTNAENRALQDIDQSDLFDQLDHATFIRSVHSEQQLYEVMCDFWSNHFNTWRRASWMGFLKQRDNEDVVRPYALGKFSDMLSASAHSPAMLDYLDNTPSDASSPGGVNENYARELMELHTLGIIDGVHVYTEADVGAVARVISGWSINWDDGPTKYDFKYSPWLHDYDPVSAFGGAFTVPARSYGQGYADGVALIDFLAHHPSTARYVCYKLVRLFVDDDPPMSLVDSAAAVFSANDTAIAPTLRHIFHSAEFAASHRVKMRRPLHHLVACLRAMDADFGTDPLGKSADALRSAMDDLGQPIFERHTPDGYPELGPYWISSDGLINRWETAARIARNRLGNTSTADKVSVDLASLMPSSLPSTASALVRWIGSELANVSISPADAAALCAAIGVDPDGPATDITTEEHEMSMAFGLVFSHPIFQRR
jgi:uncharacterized protein (DUF1800 family)